VDELIAFYKNLNEVLKQTSKDIQDSASAERTMFDATLQRERQMSEADGLNYSEEELEEIAMKQVENSASRQRRDNAIERLEAALDG
tara:strand:- start:246 stop:506 length:261 start_codon:yes stop_codon:yes gene_type:complete